MKFIIYQAAMSLNNYIHLHWGQKKNIKNKWMADIHYEIAMQKVKKKKFKKPVEISYTLNFMDKRRRDLDNFGFTAHKFTCDALVGMGILTDDNTKVIKALHFKKGNKNLNSIEVEIYETKN